VWFKGRPLFIFFEELNEKKSTQIFKKYPMSEKVGNVYFYDNFSKCRPIFTQFFSLTVKFRNELRRKLELKLSPPLKSDVTLPCEK